jgi:serine/threonine protein kinase
VSAEPGSEGELALARPEPDTLERKVFEARLEARLLGGEPQLPLIDRFVLERMLGAGGMGTVWLAHDQALDRRVALKLVRGGGTAAGERMRLREARGLARIAHPNVIAVYDVGEHEGRVWLAMEFVPGRTLRDCAAELEREQVLALWIAAGHGLAAIHAAGLVHRDVKPDNVLLGDDGRVRVIDLGLVREAAKRDGALVAGPDPRASEVVITPGFVGTRSYAAPEQQRGEPVDARADQFAFCVSLLESLRAAKPGQARADEPLPAGLLEALARGRDAEPARRFASMDELLAVLESATHRARATRWAWVLGVVVVVVGLIAAALAWPSRPDPAWSECMARAQPVCDGQASEVIELVLACADPNCDALHVQPSAALLVGERLPFDIDVDNRTAQDIELRWHAAGDARRSGRGRLEPGRQPLPPHWQAGDVPICVDVVDARGQVSSIAIDRAAACTESPGS